MWTLVNVKADLEEFFVQKFFRLLGRQTQVFKTDENKEFRLAQNLTMGEAEFNQFIRLRNELVVALRNFSKEENLKGMEEQLRLTHKVVEAVDRPLRNICVTMLRYNVEKPETSFVHVRLFGRRKDDEKFNQTV